MGNLGPVLGAFGLFALIVGLLMFIPLKVLRTKRRTARWLSIGGLVSFVFGLILSPPPAEKPASAVAKSSVSTSALSRPRPTEAKSEARATTAFVREAPAKIINSGYYEPILNLDIDLGEHGARSGDILARGGDEVLKIGKAIVAGAPPVSGKIDTINFTILGPGGRAEGNGRKVAHFSIATSDLTKLAKRDADSDKMFDLTREFGTWAPANNDIVADFCKVHAVRKICLT